MRPFPALRLVAFALLVTACDRAPEASVVSGTIEVRQVSVAPLTDGRLVELRRDEGDTVNAGDTIAVLAQPGLPARLGEARARLQAARARVEDLEAGARPAELALGAAAVVAAFLDSGRAARDAGRVAQLSADDVATPDELDGARTVAAIAAARLQQARASLALLEAGARPQQVRTARREAEAAAQALRGLEAQAEELVLLAPQPGVIVLRLAEVGEVVAAGTPVSILGLTQRPWARAFVPQRWVGRVRLGAPVRLTVDAYPDTAFAGTVRRIATEAEFIPRAALTDRERADLVFAVEVAIDDAGGRLKAGMPADLDIEQLP